MCFQQLLKTRVILIFNFTRPHTITYTNPWVNRLCFYPEAPLETSIRDKSRLILIYLMVFSPNETQLFTITFVSLCTLHRIISETSFNMKFDKKRISLNWRYWSSLKTVKDNKGWTNKTIMKWKLEKLKQVTLNNTEN